MRLLSCLTATGVTLALAASLPACSGEGESNTGDTPADTGELDEPGAPEDTDPGNPDDPGDSDDPMIPDEPDEPDEPMGPSPGAGEGDALDTSPATELDLLFVIDNSVSMGDKQQILQESIAPVVARLAKTGLHDIHLGVITTSIGGHGASVCSRGEPNVNSASGFWDNDDQAYLIPHKRPQVVTQGEPTSAFPEGAGFLAWNGGTESELWAFESDLEEHLVAAGENGCGFEAPLEAWYRFLVDPEPPTEIILDDSQRSVSTGVDETLLAQREAFLRPGGLVGIVIVSDEDDCSAMDGGSYYNNAGFGYLTSNVVPSTFNLPVATSVCEANPNDACCFSCLQKHDPPVGCESYASECDGTPSPVLTSEEDRANLRCFDQKRRFGVDFLYPTDRYVDALTQYEIINARTGEVADNPLLRGAGSNAATSRETSRVFIAGIVGVPWQDVATPETLDSPNANELLDARELGERNVNAGGELVSRFELMLGNPGLPETSKRCEEDLPGCGVRPTLPYDPFMISSITPRIGTHASGDSFPTQNPISGDAIVAANSNDPRANNINGHEADHGSFSNSFGGPANDDLQFACTFPLSTPRSCDSAIGGCDCYDEPSRNSPTCQPPTGGIAGTTQYYAKAYPAPRIITVLSQVPDQAVVSSICPKVLAGDPESPSFGYNPTFEALFAKFNATIAATQ